MNAAPSRTTFYRARCVMPRPGFAIDGGAVVVRGDRIAAVGPWADFSPGADDAVVDAGDALLMPGLVNAHCHLDFTCMRGAVLASASFSAWIRRLNELKRTLSDDDYLRSIEDGFAELAGNGTTTVFNIESFPELMVRLRRPPIRTWWFYEMMDIRNRIETEEVVAGALSFFEARPGWPGGFGLSPHAPFTTSPELYAMAKACSEKYAMPVTTHLAESDEESEMFESASGKLYDFLESLGRDMRDCGSGTPIARLLGAGLLPDGAILAHMNRLGPGDDDILARRAGRFAIVHCPNCHAYFGREPFPYGRLRDLGFEISLGTDSLASNRKLDMFAELRAFARQFPEVPPDERLRMVTEYPARAIGMAGRIGVLAPGAFADMVAIPFDGSARTAAEHAATFGRRVAWSLVGGEAVSQFSVESPPRSR